jgi:hypothetical protein
MEPLEELKVLLEYLVGHNQEHAAELTDLAARVQTQGNSRAHEYMMKGVELLNESNDNLRAALAALGD